MDRQLSEQIAVVQVCSRTRTRIYKYTNWNTGTGGEMIRLSVGLALAVAALLSIPSVATAADYETFVGCDDLAENPIPSHVCELGDFPGAYFESDAEVEVEVCVDFPTAPILCTDPELAEAGILYVFSITSELEGEHLVTWYVEGEEVGSWIFRLESPPPPPVVPSTPTPAPSPPPVPSPSPVVTAGPPTPACLKARQRVRMLGRQLQNAGSRKQKAKIRGKLGKARTTARRACRLQVRSAGR